LFLDLWSVLKCCFVIVVDIKCCHAICRPWLNLSRLLSCPVCLFAFFFFFFPLDIVTCIWLANVSVCSSGEINLTASYLNLFAVRSAKFIARKQWVVAGADDMFIRVYNYNTMDKVKVFEAHTDYIRCVAVHPTLPYVLSSSDDMLIKLWDWDKGWVCTQIFEGHSHYVMQVTFNPKDTNTFASASLDRTIKVYTCISGVLSVVLSQILCY